VAAAQAYARICGAPHLRLPLWRWSSATGCGGPCSLVDMMQLLKGETLVCLALSVQARRWRRCRMGAFHAPAVRPSGSARLCSSVAHVASCLSVCMRAWGCTGAGRRLAVCASRCLTDPQLGAAEMRVIGEDAQVQAGCGPIAPLGPLLRQHGLLAAWDAVASASLRRGQAEAAAAAAAAQVNGSPGS
jgi:hypothetical protein